MRSQVAEVAVAALVEEAAYNKTFELVAEENESDIPLAEQFESV